MRFLHLANVVVKICCLRLTSLKLHSSEESKQNGLLLNVETGSQELVILSYATVCPHPSVSLNHEKNVLKLVKIKQQFVRKLRVYGVGTLRIWIQHA